MSRLAGSKGKLIVLEGPDDVGKTTVARELVRQLLAMGTKSSYYSFPGSVPGSFGELIYRLHHNPTSLGITEQLHPMSRQLLHVAAHIQGVLFEISPRLDSGEVVVLDRYWWSTWAYGRSAGIDDSTLQHLLSVERSYWFGQEPNAIMLVERPGYLVDPELDAYYQHLAESPDFSLPLFRVRNQGPPSEVAADALVVLRTGGVVP